MHSSERTGRTALRYPSENSPAPHANTGQTFCHLLFSSAPSSRTTSSCTESASCSGKGLSLTIAAVCRRTSSSSLSSLTFFRIYTFSEGGGEGGGGYKLSPAGSPRSMCNPKTRLTYRLTTYIGKRVLRGYRSHGISRLCMQARKHHRH